MLSLNRSPKFWGLAIAGVIYPVIVVGVVNRLQTVSIPTRTLLPADVMRLLTLVLAVTALINVATPWMRRSRWRREAAELPHLPDAAFRSLVLGLPFVAAPASYGLLLYIFGAQPQVVLYFAAGSFLAAGTWAAQALLSRDDVLRTP